MKYLTYIFCFSIFASVGCGQANKKEEKMISRQDIDTLAEVRARNRYKLKIDLLEPKLDSILQDIYESTEGGTRKSFFQASDTLKREIVYYGETGKRILEIYLKENKAILIKDVIIKYKFPMYDSTKISIENEINNIYYLDSTSNLIYWIKENHVMQPSLYSKQSKRITKE